MDTQREVLGPREAAALLDIHEETVRRLARERKIPGFKVGGSWRFNKSDLHRLADQQVAFDHGKRVLVVDDEISIRQFLRRALESRGYSVTTAPTCAEAIAIIQQETPDTVLLDLKLPGASGVEVLKHIRSQHGDIPVVIITGYPDSELVAKALQYSPLMMLAKPIELKQLLLTLRTIFGTAAVGGPSQADALV